jgi:cytochrome c-type protein NapC
MNQIRRLVSRYWRVIRSGSTIPTGIVAVFFFLAGIGYMRAFDWSMEAGSTEEFCISCHEMKDHVYPAYTESGHYSNRSGVRATCGDCHVPHRWSDKVVRKVIATKEIWGTIIGSIDTPEKFAANRLKLAQREWVRMKKSDSLECRNCHDQSYFSSDHQGPASAYMHETMMRTGQFTCIDCHKGIAHVLPEIEDLALISPRVLEPKNRAPFDHAEMTLEQTR